MSVLRVVCQRKSSEVPVRLKSDHGYHDLDHHNYDHDHHLHELREHPQAGRGEVYVIITTLTLIMTTLPMIITTLTMIMTTTSLQCGSIHKLDVEKKEFTAKWEDPKCRATEPQFVPR